LVVTDIPYRVALIVGAGSGISASLASGLAVAGLRVGLAARNIEKLALLAVETDAETFAVDASDPAAVARLFDAADRRLGEPMSLSIALPPHRRTVRLRSSTRKSRAERSKYRPMAASLSSGRRHGA
jgi:NAD(P)-dependent dehydrogenase (short-subunit alcohol dehydrogenase family)